MNTNIHNRVKVLIEETKDAYSSCAGVNSDYAEFAALALGEFRSVLHDTRLTRRRLMQILRKGTVHHKKTATECPWETFMASYVQSASNKSAHN